MTYHKSNDRVSSELFKQFTTYTVIAFMICHILIYCNI